MTSEAAVRPAVPKPLHVMYSLQPTRTAPWLASTSREASPASTYLGTTDKRMFGGIAFLHRGNMAVGVTGDDLMVRVGPDATDAALARPGTRTFDMTGRPMRGWIVVTGEAVTEDQELDEWVDEGHAFAASLPPK